MGEYKRGCTVMAGAGVEWDGKLTPSQCAEFPPIGEQRGRDPDFIEGLGTGSFATAYVKATNPEEIVKFTADKQDAIASAIVARERPVGTVTIYDVAELKGQRARAPVLVQKDGKPTFESMPDQPVFAIAADRLDPLDHSQKAAVISFWGQYKGEPRDPDAPRNIARRTDPKKLRIKTLVDFQKVKSECVARGGAVDDCDVAADDIAWSVDELASIGIIPLDLHSQNWGSKTGRSGRKSLLVLDLGVSAGQEVPPDIRQLASLPKKGKKHMRKRSRTPKSYDYTLGAGDTFGAFEIPDAKAAGSFASSLIPRALAIGALGVGVWYFLFSSKAAARENAKNAAIPTGSATGASVTAEAGAPVPTFVDPGSNVAVAGPSGTIMVSNGSYIVKRGESWSNIASRVYGDYRWWPALWDANRKLGRFGNPSTLAVGDVIVVPRLPVQSPRFKKLVFDRAEIDRAWELKKLKKGAKAAGPRPKDVFTATEVTAIDIAADAKATAEVTATVVKEPVVLPVQEPAKEVDYVTSGDMSAEPEGGVEDLSS